MAAAGGGATPATGGTGGMAGGAGTGGTGTVPPMMMMMTTVPPAMMMMEMTNPAGVGEENAPCMPAMPNCNEGLACATLPDPFNGVCGRKCAMDSECTMPDELCSAYSMTDMQGICINLVPPWDIYAFPETSACQPTSTPVRISQMDQPYGLCLELCVLPGADPMMVPSDLPKEQLVTCGMGQECIDIGLTSDGAMMADPVLGACAIPAARGEACDLQSGAHQCVDLKDICLPVDTMNLMGDAKCYQNCTEMGVTCEMGTTCTNLMVMGMPTMYSYCL